MINQQLNPYDFQRSSTVWTTVTKNGHPFDYCDNIDDARRMVDRLNREHNARVIRLHQLEELHNNEAEKYDMAPMLRYINSHIPPKITPKKVRPIPEAWIIREDSRGFIVKLFNT